MRETYCVTPSSGKQTNRFHPSSTIIMAENGAEKRKADEMTADSVEVPLAELKELAAKGGEQTKDHAPSISTCSQQQTCSGARATLHVSARTPQLSSAQPYTTTRVMPQLWRRHICCWCSARCFHLPTQTLRWVHVCVQYTTSPRHASRELTCCNGHLTPSWSTYSLALVVQSLSLEWWYVLFIGSTKGS